MNILEMRWLIAKLKMKTKNKTKKIECRHFFQSIVLFHLFPRILRVYFGNERKKSYQKKEI